MAMTVRLEFTNWQKRQQNKFLSSNGGCF